MSGRQLAEWQAYWQLEPFGPPAEFWRSGLIASTLQNGNRTKKTQRVAKPEDYMPKAMTDDHEDRRDDMSEKVLRTFQDVAELQKHGQ